MRLHAILWITLLTLVLASCVPAGAPTPGAPAPASTPIVPATVPAAPAATPAVASTPTAAAAPAVAATPTTAATPAAAPAGGHTGPVKIGSKDFTEALLLGEMYALVLEANNIPVQRRLNLAGTQVAHESLLRGEIDLYPEYTGTGYIFILDIQDGEKDPTKVYQRVAAEYKQRWNLVWLEASPMNDTNAIACSRAAAQQHNLKTVSDLSREAPNIDFAAIPDFEQRPDGLRGLKDLYGGFLFKSMTVYDPGLKYRAVADGRAQCVIAFSTDAQIRAQDLVVLEDDKGLWPPYNVAPVIREATLNQYPAAREALNRLSPLITTEAITELNFQVDVEKREYADVARAFLRDKGLVR
jgi:osmoprotectant transport system substrate-binding protein